MPQGLRPIPPPYTGARQLGGHQDSPGPGCWTPSWRWELAQEWAYLGESHSQAEQDCGELETGHAAASLSQGLMAPGGWNGVVGHGQDGRSAGDKGQGQEVLQCPQVSEVNIRDRNIAMLEITLFILFPRANECKHWFPRQLGLLWEHFS